MSESIITECCGMAIGPDCRYCPKCGYEARVEADESLKTVLDSECVAERPCAVNDPPDIHNVRQILIAARALVAADEFTVRDAIYALAPNGEADSAAMKALQDAGLVSPRADVITLSEILALFDKAISDERVAEPAVSEQPERPKIICLCGSTRFVDTWVSEYQRLSDEGNIVLTVARMPPRPNLQHDEPQLKQRLDELHKRKIDLADEVFVLDVDGYVGESTKSEIAYAMRQGKEVRYLSRAAPVHAVEAQGEPQAGCNGGDHRDCDLDAVCQTEAAAPASAQAGPKLLACPFCGANARWMVSTDPPHPKYNQFVECWGCGADSPFCTTKNEAIAAWNRRATPRPVGVEEPSDKTISSQFHKVWTSQVGTEGYDKDQWQKLVVLLRQRGIQV